MVMDLNGLFLDPTKGYKKETRCVHFSGYGSTQSVPLLRVLSLIYLILAKKLIKIVQFFYLVKK